MTMIQIINKVTPNINVSIGTNIKKNINREIIMIGYLVSTKKTITKNGEIMYFGTFTDEDGEFLDSVHFPESSLKHPFRGKGIYKLKGKVTEEFDFYSLEINYMERLHYKKDKRYD